MCEPMSRSRSREPILRATAVFSVFLFLFFNSTSTLDCWQSVFLSKFQQGLGGIPEHS